jgi:hypothetical protein
MDTFLRNLVKKNEWQFPDIDTLKGDPYKGLTELRWKSGRLPHRIFGFESGDHEYVMLIGCTHRDTYHPPDAMDTAADRQKILAKGEASLAKYELITNL